VNVEFGQNRITRQQACPMSTLYAMDVLLVLVAIHSMIQTENS
jgi:hypothetical protein